MRALHKKIESRERQLNRWVPPTLFTSKNRPVYDASFAEYISEVAPHIIFYRHVDLLVGQLQEVADKEVKKLLVFEPPRHGKSEIISRLFPGYYLRRWPDEWVGLGSYAAELAFTLSRNARDNYMRSGGEVSSQAQSVKHWETDGRGGMWAAGAGGPITGKGFHLGISDDLIKNSQEASSARVRDSIWDWRRSTWNTRREPDAAEVFVMTRWHKDDPAGRIVSEDSGWRVLHYPAIKPEGDPIYPSGFEVVPDWREPGEALCPERYPLQILDGTRDTLGEYYFSALYQQTPVPEEGAIWRSEWFEGNTFTEIPAGLRSVGYDWDTAYTSTESNSATAYVKGGIDANGVIYLLDFGFKWVEFPDQIRWMMEVGGPNFIEKKATGKSAAQTLKENGVHANEVPVKGGDKVSRTHLATPKAERGNLRVYKPLLERLLHDDRQGILAFPHGSHDDVNDALVQMIQRLTLTETYVTGAAMLPGL